MKFWRLFPGAIALLLLGQPFLAAAQPAKPAPEGFNARPGASPVGADSLQQILQSLDQDSLEQVNPELLTRYCVSGFVRAYEELGKKADSLLLLELAHPSDRGAVLAQMDTLTRPLTPAQRQACYLAAMHSVLHGYNEPGTMLYEPGAYSKSLDELGYSVGGVGIFFDEEPDPQGTFKIVQMMQGFPAEKLGIRPGDRLASINGQSLKGKNVQQVASLIRGPVGTAVDLGILSGSQTRHYTIQRAWLNPNPKGAESRLEAGQVAWIRMKYLGLRSDIDVSKLLEGLSPAPKRLVLDLRNCQGEIEGSAPFLSLFLPSGQLAYQIRSRSGVESISTQSTKPAFNLPMVVLINQFTGDAASIVAGSLRDHGRALLVGRPTDPKEMKAYRWSAQELPDGSTATITTTTFLLPLGQALVNGGLRPDVFVSAKDAAAEVTGTPDDKAYRKALEILQEEK